GVGGVTYLEYDAAGNVVKTIEFATLRDTSLPVTDAALRAWMAQGSVAGNLANRVTVTEYDALGRRIRETVDPLVDEGENDEHAELDLITQFVYGATGDLTRKIDAAGHSTWFVYDAASRLRFTVNALGEISELVYDALGRVTQTRAYA